MVNIPFEYLQKYGLTDDDDTTIEDSMNNYDSERDWLQTFLDMSDYVSNKIIEAQYLGDEIEDLREIVEIRQRCRVRIRELEI